VINDKLQGCVARNLRCGWVVNNQIKKCVGLLLSLTMKKINIGECLAKLQARTWLTRALFSAFNSVVAKRTMCGLTFLATLYIEAELLFA